MNALTEFQNGLADNLAGAGGAVVSVCSAHPDVLRALFRTAKKMNQIALIESTSNQVDQYGGYTGMTPADFVAAVRDIAAQENFPFERVLLGGDHLGTNSWRSLPAAKAMEETRTLVAAYMQAGYKKIHLDASFVCADDTAPLSDEITAQRSAEMAKVCEEHAGDEPPVYVVGTEVPTPGGATDDEVLRPTSVQDVAQTLSVFKDIFYQNGLESAWSRVVGLVVQPGVEFGDDFVHDYVPTPELSAEIRKYSGISFEAHSTDYQTPGNLDALARHHFYILKVGPWLTFALREALYALEQIEKELAPGAPSNFRETLMEVMENDPKYWQSYYNGAPLEVDIKKSFSYSDRARYYLGRPEVKQAQQRLLSNVGDNVPESLLSQYMPLQYQRARMGAVPRNAHDLAIDAVSYVLEQYMAAGT